MKLAANFAVNGKNNIEEAKRRIQKIFLSTCATIRNTASVFALLKSTLHRCTKSDGVRVF